MIKKVYNTQNFNFHIFQLNTINVYSPIVLEKLRNLMYNFYVKNTSDNIIKSGGNKQIFFQNIQVYIFTLSGIPSKRVIELKNILCSNTNISKYILKITQLGYLSEDMLNAAYNKLIDNIKIQIYKN